MMKKNMIALLIASILVISSVSFGVTILGTNTEPETTGGIRVTKYNDLNMNEWWDRHDGEEALEGWTINLYERVDDEWVYFDEKVTDQYGEVYWHDVPVGEYLLEEVMQDHWMNTTSETKEITVVEDQYACHNFGNVQAGSISAWKFHDKNMDGVWTQPCEGVPGWEIEVWRDDKLWYSGETDEEGKVCFDDVPPGEYTVVEETRDNWTNTTPTEVDVMVEQGETETVEFGNVMYGYIKAYKFYDENTNGEWDEDEDPIEDWEIILYDETGTNELQRGYTNSGGCVRFDKLLPGTYVVREEERDGWFNTTETEVSLKVNAGQQRRFNFGNSEYGSITIYKFNDLNMDGMWDEELEPLIDGVPFSAGDGMEGFSGDSGTGMLNFDFVMPGSYTVIEDLPEGWLSTTPLEQSFDINSGEHVELYFGNIEQVGNHIRVCKFYDRNLNGSYDEGEEMLSNWTFNLWNTTNGEVDSIIDTNTTGANGCAMFWDLEPGLYAVEEVLEENGEWFNTTDRIQFIEVVSGETADLWFGNAQYAGLDGLKFCDFNLDGYADDGEEPLEGWTIHLWSVDELGNPEEIIDTQITNEWGWYNFGSIMPGEYYVQEESPNGWFNSTPTLVYVDLEPGEQRRVDFGNYKLTNITGMKFFDINQDGEYNETDEDYPIEDWMINLWSTNETTGLPEEVIQTSYTDEDGYYYFLDVKPGYYWVQEEVPEGWINTTDSLVQVRADCSNEVIMVNFGNYQEEEQCRGMIYGHKFFDTNQDGVYDGDDWYMDGWKVNLWNTVNGEKDEIIRTAYTDGNGYFSFPELEAGYYYVEEVLPEGWMNTTELGIYIELDCDDEEEVLFGNWAPIVCGPEGHTRGFWKHNVCRDGPGEVGYQVPYDDVVMYLENITERYEDDYEFLEDLDMQKACETLTYSGPDMKQKAEVHILALLLTAEHYDYYESEPMVHIPGIHHDYFFGTMEEAIEVILDHYDLGTHEGYEAAKDMADWLNNIDAGETYNEMFEGCYMLEP